MEKYNELNLVETELLRIPKSDFLERYMESYRSRLYEKYKKMIFDDYEDALTLQLMRELVEIMDASDEVILKMFFEDAHSKYAQMDGKHI